MREGVEILDIELLRPALEDAMSAGPEQKGLPKKDLKVPLATRGKLKQIMAKLKDGLETKNLVDLRASTEDGLKQKLPERDLKEAVALKAKLEQLHARLKVAMALLDLETLTAAIDECQKEGFAPEELEEAITSKNNIERLLNKVTSAIAAKDSDKVKTALMDCGIEMFKTAFEACRTAGLPERELAEAVAAREERAPDLPDEERQRLLLSIKTCNEKEMRETHDKVVVMLRDAIKTGSDVPEEFDDLVNELIVNTVM
jgi:hypothetical protein